MIIENKNLFIGILAGYLVVNSLGIQRPKLFEKHLPMGKVVFYKTARTSKYITPREEGKFYILGGEQIAQEYTLFFQKKSAPKIVLWKKTTHLLNIPRPREIGRLEIWDVFLEPQKGYILYLDEARLKIDNIQLTSLQEWKVTGTIEVQKTGPLDTVFSGRFQNNKELKVELQTLVDQKKQKEIWAIQNGVWVKEKDSVPIEKR